SVTLGIVALLAILLTLGIGQAMTVVSLNTLVSFTAPDDEQGGAFGLTQSAGGLARAIGPGVAGVLYSVMYWSPFVAGGLLFLPVIYLLWQFEPRD
ncbi:MAG: MFS transporter, partial [Candidatus Nanohaloarchaea archaeon]|nr:MFS transporter [Candidatus Nanohaloarchaea archaeon]